MKNKILSFLIVSVFLIISLNSGCKYDEIVPKPPEGEIKFSMDIIPIFNASCNFSGCHGFGDKPPDLSVNNAYNSLTTGGYIDLDAPDQSELYQWVKGNRALPMPTNGTDPQIAATILEWINQGAKNN